MPKLTPLEKRQTAEALARCNRPPVAPARTIEERLGAIEEQLGLVLARLESLAATHNAIPRRPAVRTMGFCGEREEGAA